MKLPINSFLENFKVTENIAFPEANYFSELSKSLLKQNNNSLRIFNQHRSRSGRPLTAFAIGEGHEVIGVTAGAHADEPIGVLTQYYLIDNLLNNDDLKDFLKRYTFLLHPLVDPDGYELNSVWFKNPLNYRDCFLHNYRNNHFAEDCEHGIPFQEGQTARPEMLFVKENLDRYCGKINYYVTLHSTHVIPGACFVFDRDHNDVNLRNFIAKLCKSYELPLMDYKMRGEDTVSYLGPGFLGAPEVAQLLNHYKNQPEVSRHLKMSTYEYAKTHCGAESAFISELPLWINEGYDDYSDSAMTLKEYKTRQFENKKIYFQKLNEIDRDLARFSIPAENIWFSSLKTALHRLKNYLPNEEAKLNSYEGFAQMLDVKELETQGPENTSRALKYAIKSTENILSAQSFRSEMEQQFNAALSEHQNKMNLRQLPLKTQIEIQLGLIFSGILAC